MLISCGHACLNDVNEHSMTSPSGRAKPSRSPVLLSLAAKLERTKEVLRANWVVQGNVEETSIQ